MHKPMKLAAWPRRQRSTSVEPRAVGSGAAGARGQVLLARRHRALHQPAEDLRAAARARSSTTRRAARTSICRCGTRPSISATATSASTTRCAASSTGCRRSRASICTARRSSLPPCIAQDAEQKFGAEGPRAFQCRRQPGGRGQPQARAQRQERQEPDVRLRGRLSRPHARRLRHHLVLPLSPPLRPLRRPRAVRAVPLPLPRPQGHEQGGVRPPLRQAVRAPVRERIQRRVGSEGRRGRVRRLLRRADPGHRRLRHSAEELLRRAEEGARPARHPAGRRRNPDGLLSHRQAVVDRALRREARHHRVRQGHHQRPQSAGRRLGARGADQPARSSRRARRTPPSTPTRWAPPSRSRP